MRLTDRELNAICEAFKDHFQKDDHLWVFGSRIDPAKKGGDIDLYIETNYQDAQQVTDAKINFLVALKCKIGDQKIDVVIKFKEDDRLIYRVAKQEGIRIV